MPICYAVLICAWFFPHKFSDDQKLLRIEHWKDIIKQIKKDKHLIYNIVIGEETWCFQYDPETKRQSAECPCIAQAEHQTIKSDEHTDLFLCFQGY